MKKEEVESLSLLFNQSLEKGISVLLAFGPQNDTMNLSEIASASGMSKSAAQRFTYTLEALGYLRKDPKTKRYSLTPATLALGYRYLLVNRMVERANPFLFDLNRACGETVNYAEPDGTDMVYVGRFPSTKSTPVQMPIGRRLPMFCTSTGRAYLSCLDLTARTELLEQSQRVAYTSKTVTKLPQLLAFCDEAQMRGYATADCQYYAGDLNVAAPVMNEKGLPVGAINISIPSTRWSMARVQRELAPMLIETARIISTRDPTRTQLEPFSIGSGVMLTAKPQVPLRK